MKRSLKNDRKIKLVNVKLLCSLGNKKGHQHHQCKFLLLPTFSGQEVNARFYDLRFCQFIPGLKSTPEEKNKTHKPHQYSSTAQTRRRRSRIMRLRRYHVKNLKLDGFIYKKGERNKMRKETRLTLLSHLGPEAKLGRRGLVLPSSPRPRGQSKGERMEARGSGKDGPRQPG